MPDVSAYMAMKNWCGSMTTRPMPKVSMAKRSALSSTMHWA